MIHKMWEGKYRVLERKRCKIGVRLEVGNGGKVDLWNIYVGEGKHRDFDWVEGDGNVVVMGDVNARNEWWGGDEEKGNVNGDMVRDWLEKEGFELGTPRGVNTWIGGGCGKREGVLDIGVWHGDMEVRGVAWERIGGLDHRPVEMWLKVVGEELRDRGVKWGRVDWNTFKCLLLQEKSWEVCVERLKGGGRRELDEVVEEMEELWGKMVKGSRFEGKWFGGRKRWWNGEVERKYKELREWEKVWERGGRNEENWKRVVEEREEWGKLVKKVKGEHWSKYVEGLGVNEGYKWIKGDRDFVLDVPPIEVEGGRRVEGDREKGRAILEGLGKREKLRQEEEGFEGKVELEEEEVEDCLARQGDGKAAGENGLGGKVFKELWKVEGSRKVILEVYRRSLELGYVPRRFRSSVGIIMRKPNKPDYGLPSSYRVINLLDVWGKGLERLVCGRLEKWGDVGLGKEQMGARKGRSSLEAVGLLRDRWERGGERGLLLCMDVMGGYENVGVKKMEERLEALGVDLVLRKWVSSFLREREVVVKIGSRIGERVEIKGGTVQGSPLSPFLFMLILGGVLEEVRKEGVEGVELVAVVDDVDMMFVGDGRKDILEKVRRVEVGMERGLKKWEVDVQRLKTEGMWMRRDVKEGEGGEVFWLGEKMRLMQSVRVLGVWFQSDGGWREHVKNRCQLAHKRWQMMLKLLGKNGRGMSVRNLGRIFRAVVEKCLLYGMEVYWNGAVKMRIRLQRWINKGLRRILGAVMSTPVDAMLGEIGWKRVEYELDKRVARWGVRLLRGRGVEGKLYGSELRLREQEGRGSYEKGLVGEMIRGVRKEKLEGERWEIDWERRGKVGWEIEIGKGKREVKEEWEASREKRMMDWVVGMSDASKEKRGVGIGGGIWEGEELLDSWNKNGGRGLTVENGEMWGLGRVLKWMVRNYEGERRRIVVGVDNMGILKKLGKSRGWCGELEWGVRKWGERLLLGGWKILLKWIPGHVGIWENELVDEEARIGCYEEEDRKVGNMLSWGEWEARRKERERRCWKEFWVLERKGEEYFGSGGGGELGHEGRRWISRMLVWLRTNHGAMSGARYFVDRGECVCGEREDRDHYLLYCRKWEGLRNEVWRGWNRGCYWDEGWVDMERMLFGEDGVKRVEEFAERSGWKDRRWKSGRWSTKEDREGMLWKPVREELGGWLGGMSEEKRRREKEMRKARKKRYEKRVREGLVGSRASGMIPNASIIPKVERRDRVEKRRLVLKEVRINLPRGRKVLGEVVGNVRYRGGLNGKGLGRGGIEE